MTHRVRYVQAGGRVSWECLSPWCGQKRSGFASMEAAVASAVAHLT